MQPIIFSNFETIHVNNAAAVSTFYGPDTADRATVFAGLDAQQHFVQTLYLNVLGRAGGMAELNGWVNVLNGPGGSTGLVAWGIEHSQEARERLVKSWYLAFLGRPARGGEELNLVNLLLLGQTEEDVLSVLLGGAEFLNHAQTLSATGPPDQRFVQALFLLLLNRSGQSAEIATQVSRLATVSRQQLAREFMTTGALGVEFRAALVESYFVVLLHRRPRPSGLTGWINTGLDAVALRVAIDGSEEFFANG
jgi:hypothetical protein